MEKNLIQKSTSYKNATGPIGYGMTNDYMFRTVLQKNNYVLKGLICSLLHLKPQDVTSVVITNPIELGDAVDDKEFILDINVLLNDCTVINLEMQMAYQYDWNDRALSYLCRSFDQLYHGDPYGKVKPTIHIGFLNFSPRNAVPEFYASYKMINEKSFEVYSDKFNLRVVNLKQINLATEEDRTYKIDYWARLFTATSWEEMKELAQNDAFMDSALQSIYESNADEITRQKCRAREEYNKREQFATQQMEINKLLTKQLEESENAIAKKDEEIAKKDNTIAVKDDEIAALKKILAENGITTE